MKSGIHDFNITFSSRIFTLLLGIAIQSILAWSLGPAGRGSYAVCLLFTTILSLIFIVGYEAPITYFVASKKFNISEGLVYSFIYGGIGSVLAVLAGLIIMRFPLEFLSKATPVEFLISLIIIPVSMFSYTFLRFLTALQLFSMFAIFSVTNVVIHLILTFILLNVFELGVVGALAAIITSGICNITNILFFLKYKYDFKWICPTLNNLYQMFHYGIRYYVGKLSNMVNFRMGTIILAFFASTEDIGLFAVAASISTRVTIIPDTLKTLLMPKVAVDAHGRKELIAQSSRLTGLICGALLLILVIFAEYIVKILFSEAFLSAVLLIRIISIGVLIRCICKLFAPYLLGTNRPGLASVSVAAGMVVNLSLLIVLLPIIGLPGAALGMTAGYFISSAILIVSFQKLSQLRYKDIFKYRKKDFLLVMDAFTGVKEKIFLGFKRETLKDN